MIFTDFLFLLSVRNLDKYVRNFLSDFNSCK